MPAADSTGRRLAQVCTILLCAVLLTIVQHGTTVGYGFYYDDYHFVHPYTFGEVAAAFHGPWDATGIETAYYRPLTICLYAARFFLFGLNSTAYHALSLGLFAAAAALLGIVVMRASDSFMGGLLATATLVVHPGMPYSAVAWITNQMHLMQLLVVITAFGWWFHVRRRSAGWWAPLVVLQVAALMIKEDGVMLLPSIVALHTARKWLVERDLPHVPVRFVAVCVAAMAALLVFRSSALHGAAHTRIPSFDQARYNVWRGLSSAFELVPARRRYQWSASWFVILVPLLAAALWVRIPRPTRFVMIAGLIIGVLFVSPFIFIIKAEQLHIVSLGAALFLAGAGTGVVQAWPTRRAWRAATAATFIGGLVLLALVSRDIARDFEPFAPGVLATDVHAQGWAAVPIELREYLARKRTADRQQFDPNPARGLEIVGFGLHGRETTAGGISLRWMGQPAAQFYVRRDKRLLTIPLRHEIGAFREPAHLRVSVDGRVVQEITLADDSWHRVDLVLKPRDVPRLGGMHVVGLQLDHAWIPSQVVPGSTDTRTLGVQVGTIDAR